MKHAPELTPIAELIARLHATHPALAEELATICANDPTNTRAMLTTFDADDLLDATESARTVNLSKPAFWRAVRDRRLPAPVYPAPRAPRWFRGELHRATLATRALPAAQMATRRLRRRVNAVLSAP